MDWLITELQDGWALIAGFGIDLGTIGLLAWNTMVSSRLGSKRVDRLLNFTTVAHKTFTDVGKDVKDLFSTFKAEMQQNVIAPMQAQLNAERKENTILKDLLVSTLAIANVPLNQKQAMYDFAKHATSVSAEAIKILEQSIQNDMAKQEQASQTQNAIKDALTGV